MLKKTKSHGSTSDIDRYFNTELVPMTEESDSNWLFSWWKAHAGEYPRMAAAARDYLAIPAAEVSVERLFSSGRDLLGLRRQSMSSETMRLLMLLKDMYK